jgi:hypothetical protein
MVTAHSATQSMPGVRKRMLSGAKRASATGGGGPLLGWGSVSYTPTKIFGIFGHLTLRYKVACVLTTLNDEAAGLVAGGGAILAGSGSSSVQEARALDVSPNSVRWVCKKNLLVFVTG